MVLCMPPLKKLPEQKEVQEMEVCRLVCQEVELLGMQGLGNLQTNMLTELGKEFNFDNYLTSFRRIKITAVEDLNETQVTSL